MLWHSRPPPDAGPPALTHGHPAVPANPLFTPACGELPAGGTDPWHDALQKRASATYLLLINNTLLQDLTLLSKQDP